MSTELLSLWPEQLRIEVQTPHHILQAQANLLPQLTQEILRAVVETESAHSKVQHRLVVIAPAYNGYRHTLITVIHSYYFPYPVEVRADCLEKQREVIDSTGEKHLEVNYPKANNDDELRSLVKQVLQEGSTVALLASLILKSTTTEEPIQATDEAEE